MAAMSPTSSTSTSAEANILTKIQAEIDTVLSRFSVQNLKSEQEEVLTCLLSKKDCMAVLPTGYGKSLPYQMLVPLLRELSTISSAPVKDHLKFHCDQPMVIVLSPLISLMTDQVSKLRGIGLSAGFVGESSDIDNEIESGFLDVVFGSPESLVGNRKWRDWLKYCQDRISTLVIDEFHTVAEWGGVKEKEQAFRVWFRHVGELRSLVPGASVLALSATCTKDVKKHVASTLNLKMQTTKFISGFPNKENIKYAVRKVNRDAASALCWAVDALKEDPESLPRIICHAPSVAKVAQLYKYMTQELPDCDFIEMYHAKTPEYKKQAILKSLCEDTGVRILFCTNALGMGVDVKGCHNIIHFDPPRSIVDYIQQTGRVGRDGLPSLCLLMYSTLRHTSPEMKNFVKESKCRRLAMMENFSSKSEMKELQSRPICHACCDLCANECECGECCSFLVEDLTKAVIEVTSDEEEDLHVDDDEVHVVDISSSDISSGMSGEQTDSD